MIHYQVYGTGWGVKKKWNIIYIRMYFSFVPVYCCTLVPFVNNTILASLLTSTFSMVGTQIRYCVIIITFTGLTGRDIILRNCTSTSVLLG